MKKHQHKTSAKETNPISSQNSQTSGGANQASPDVENPTKGNEQQTTGENTVKFAHFAQFAHLASQQKDPDERLVNTSNVPDEVYENLPEILKRGTSVFTNQREKDVFLSGALGVLSGLFSSVLGLYDSGETYSNLNIFIVGPPGVGKGPLKYAKYYGKAIHKARLDFSGTTYAPAGAQLLLYIPANSSSAVVIRHLKENNQNGIIFETEADTLSNTFNQDWGGYSELIRKAFHHESISYSRKKDREFIEIDQPKLSIVLSGTPDQVKSLIHSSENGLFSRIIFYAFEGNDLWRSVAPKAEIQNRNTFFEGLGAEMKTVYDSYASRAYEFGLTKEQWDTLDNQFRVWLNEITTFIHKDTSSIVKRLSLVQFRLAMILSILRHFEEGNIEETNIICSDRDFKTAQLLANLYLEHGLNMFFNLPGESKSELNIFIKRFYDIIPKEVVFTRASAVIHGSKIGIKERAIDKYLKRLVEIGFLIQPEYGTYKKP